LLFVGPTTLGQLRRERAEFRKRDNILIYRLPWNVYPWMALAERGVEVRLLNVRELGKFAPWTQGQVDENTRLWRWRRVIS
jgi:selenocysteine lyase/cysteine desulfurase